MCTDTLVALSLASAGNRNALRKEEASNEISLWFKPDEIYDYKRAEEDIMF